MGLVLTFSCEKGIYSPVALTGIYRNCICDPEFGLGFFFSTGREVSAQSQLPSEMHEDSSCIKQN